VAQSLKDLGFEVRELQNGSYHDLSRFLAESFATIERQDRKNNFVFYYAGHGIQVNGANYLMPIDAKLMRERDIEFELVPMESVLASLRTESIVGALVILDAAHTNTFDSGKVR